jgi:hypothetical protein
MLHMPMGRDYVSELQPTNDLLFIPQMYVFGEPRWNDIDRERRLWLQYSVCNIYRKVKITKGSVIK